jgi:hypothetical protein
MSRHRKTKQLEIATVCDLERLGCIRDREISRPANLLMTALRVAANPLKLKVDKGQVIPAPRYMRA